VKVLYLLAEI